MFDFIRQLYHRITSKLYKFYHHILYQITGKTKLHRLLDNSKLSDTERTLQLYHLLQHSEQCKHVYLQLTDIVQHGTVKPTDSFDTATLEPGTEAQLNDCTKSLCRLKLISTKKNPKTYNTLKFCILTIAQLLHLQYHLVPYLASIPYDSTNAQHEKQLVNIFYQLTNQRITVETRYSTVWQLIGFQANNPATDFRSTGTFGLLQLYAFCAYCNRYSKHICAQFVEAGHLLYFSFAITGINISGDIMMLVRTSQLNYLLLQYGINLNTLNMLYASMFVEFNERWRAAKPKSVMEYGIIHDKFLNDLQDSLRQRSYRLRDGVIKSYTKHYQKSFTVK